MTEPSSETTESGSFQALPGTQARLSAHWAILEEYRLREGATSCEQVKVILRLLDNIYLSLIPLAQKRLTETEITRLGEIRTETKNAYKSDLSAMNKLYSGKRCFEFYPEQTYTYSHSESLIEQMEFFEQALRMVYLEII